MKGFCHISQLSVNLGMKFLTPDDIFAGQFVADTTTIVQTRNEDKIKTKLQRDYTVLEVFTVHQASRNIINTE